MIKESSERLYCKTLIIGSGIAGCCAALTMADKGVEVTLINAGSNLGGGNSELAQGGIIYTTPERDDAPALQKDILVAGHRLNNTKAVRQLCLKGPELVDSMLMGRAGLDFDRDPDGAFNLAREGGHSTARILHRADYTGKSIMEGLIAAVEASPNIRVLTDRSAIDLLTSGHHAKALTYRYQLQNSCVGAYVFNDRTGAIETILSDFTVLATGGVGQVFLHSTNSPSSVGSGISMAQRAGASLANMEFMQFHPTSLYDKMSGRRPLITEAMRGEGARLLDGDRQAFMKRFDPRGDLAPRDIVSQAMVEMMLHNGEPCLYLDARAINQDLKKRFPTVFANCAQLGLDIREDLIPVVPSAHYFCGGILTDTNGRTSLERLYSVGECACTGLHGANRLASTSLLEGVVFGCCAGQDIARRLGGRSSLNRHLCDSIADWNATGDEHNDDPALVAQDWANIRHTMWNYVGISRTTARLKRAFESLRDLSRNIHDFYKNTSLSRPLVDLFHGCQTAYIITQAALRNTKGVGCHRRID